MKIFSFIFNLQWNSYLTLIISFVVTYITTLYLIKYLKKINLVVKDMNKENRPLIPLSGGIAVMAGLFTAFMFSIAIYTFFYKVPSSSVIQLLAATCTILIITFIGFVDDLLIHKNKEESTGLKQWQKPLLTLIAAVPLMVINAGSSKVWIPFLGETEIGLIYPLIVIPIILIGAANMVNLLGGFNGLETGMGLIYTFMLSLYMYIRAPTVTNPNDAYVGSLIAAITFAALLAFFIFNKYPAKIFPGDSLTYLLGAVIACIAIIGNFEKAALICSIPFIIEFFLKARARFKADSYGYYKDGKIQSKYTEIYSLPHIFTRTGKYTEKQITYFLMFIELIFCSLIWII